MSPSWRGVPQKFPRLSCSPFMFHNFLWENPFLFWVTVVVCPFCRMLILEIGSAGVIPINGGPIRSKVWIIEDHPTCVGLCALALWLCDLGSHICLWEDHSYYIRWYHVQLECQNYLKLKDAHNIFHSDSFNWKTQLSSCYSSQDFEENLLLQQRYLGFGNIEQTHLEQLKKVPKSRWVPKAFEYPSQL